MDNENSADNAKEDEKKKIKDSNEEATKAFDNSEIEAIKQASLNVKETDVKKKNDS